MTGYAPPGAPGPGPPGHRSPAGTRPAADRAAPAGERSWRVRPAGHAADPGPHNAPAARPAPSFHAGTATGAAAHPHPPAGMLRPRQGRAAWECSRSAPPLHQHALDGGDRPRGIEVLRAHVGAVHDGVAAVQAERILELVEPLTRGFITAVDDPAIRGQQR